MIPDRQSEIDSALRTLADAGVRGLPTSEVGVGTATWLQMMGFARVEGGRCWALPAGVAHCRRTVWA